MAKQEEEEKEDSTRKPETYNLEDRNHQLEPKPLPESNNRATGSTI